MPIMTSDQRQRLRAEAVRRLEWMFDAMSGVGQVGKDGRPIPPDRDPDADGVRVLATCDLASFGRQWGKTRVAARDAFHLIRSARADELADVWDALAARADDLLAVLVAGPAEDLFWNTTDQRTTWLRDVAMFAAAAVLPALGRAGRGDRMLTLARRFVTTITGESFVNVPGAGADLPGRDDGESPEQPKATARMILLAPVLWSIVAHLPT
jgi:hypothetical protein